MIKDKRKRIKNKYKNNKKRSQKTILFIMMSKRTKTLPRKEKIKKLRNKNQKNMWLIKRRTLEKGSLVRSTNNREDWKN